MTEETKKATKSEADKIWDEIKDLRVDMFALPNQTVKDYASPATVEPSKLYLTITTGSFINSLEMVVAVKYKVERADKYVIVSPK